MPLRGGSGGEKRASDALGQAAEAADCWARREGGRARDCGGRRRHAGPVWQRHRAGQAQGAEVSEGALGWAARKSSGPSWLGLLKSLGWV